MGVVGIVAIAILLRVGLSPVSLEGAKKNLQTEIGNRSFDEIHEQARAAWNDYLSRITVESSDRNLRETFYSTLYHTATAPTLSSRSCLRTPRFPLRLPPRPEVNVTADAALCNVGVG